jgi:polygalacturonase
MELQNITGVEVTGVTLLNSAFWTFHPTYCKDVHIHHMKIQVPWQSECCGSGFNGDGIDVDSCQNVLIEHNYINCGDDHVTILAGVGKAGQDFGMPSKNITVADNRLGSGMGISIGSSVSGGVEDVVYTRNVMTEVTGQWGLGIHIKTRTSYGGYIRNIEYSDNVFEVAGMPGGALTIESGYQSGHGEGCNHTECTEIRDIVFRNLTFKQSGSTGGVTCFPARPCQNISFENVRVESAAKGTAEWECDGVASGRFVDVYPPRKETGNCNFTSG